MDLRFDTALRNASQAWAQNRTTDSMTMQHLKRHAPEWQSTAAAPSPSSLPTHNAMPTATLSRFGTLGTKLSVYA